MTYSFANSISFPLLVVSATCILHVFWIQSSFAAKEPPLPKYEKPPQNNKWYQDEVPTWGIWYDETKWRMVKQKPSMKGKTNLREIFRSNDNLTFAFASVDKKWMDWEAAPYNVEENLARRGLSDAEFTEIELREVNDEQVLFMRVEGEYEDLPVTYLIYIHVEKEGEDKGETVQLATYTVTDFLEYIEPEVMDFMNGFVYGHPDADVRKREKRAKERRLKKEKKLAEMSKSDEELDMEKERQREKELEMLSERERKKRERERERKEMSSRKRNRKGSSEEEVIEEKPSSTRRRKRS